MEANLGDPRVDSFVFDPASPAFDEDPYPFYRYLREHAPVYWWDTGQAWVVTRYADVLACLQDKRLSRDPASAGDGKERAGAALMASSLFGLPDQEHARVRRLVNPVFAPRSVEKMRADVQAIVDAVLAGFEGREQVDVVQDLAVHVPYQVLSRLLDIPAEHEGRFRQFGVAASAAAGPSLPQEQFGQHLAAVMDGVGMIKELIEERRLHPGGDVLSTLIHFEEQGDKLSGSELLSLVATLLVAGADTTTHSLCRAVLNLLRHPDQLRLVMNDPSLARKALYEVLRFDNHSKCGPPRYAKEDLTIGGTLVRKGQMVYAIRQSAMRDPAVFADPDTFDIRRATGDTLAFGTGPHFCLGAAVALLEGDVVINTLFRRFPQMRLAGGPTYERHPLIRKMVSLPLRLHG
jgi:cytochrome P450